MAFPSAPTTRDSPYRRSQVGVLTSPSEDEYQQPLIQINISIRNASFPGHIYTQQWHSSPASLQYVCEPLRIGEESPGIFGGTTERGLHHRHYCGVTGVLSPQSTETTLPSLDAYPFPASTHHITRTTMSLDLSPPSHRHASNTQYIAPRHSLHQFRSSRAPDLRNRKFLMQCSGGD